jgi:saccharopine dehydrogenase-like NADP-dependent oxidoreductase
VRAVVAGIGAVGARAARQLASSPELTSLVVAAADPQRAASAARSLECTAAAWGPDTLRGADVVVLAGANDHRRAAEEALEAGASVVSVADRVGDVEGLLDLDAEARERGRVVVVGAGFAPGLGCLLARHAAGEFDEVDEVHLAKAGTGGPACARTHHDALAGWTVDWRDGAFVRRRGGSGRELCWFPDPVGPQDCYRAALPDALLLAPALPGVQRVTARMAASRRDRVTARLPMLRRPHAEGLLGAIRVEVRGRRGQATDTRVLGALDRPAVAAGTVAAVAAVWAASGRLSRSGAAGLGELVADPLPFLHELWDRGVRGAVFEGAGLA